MSTACSGEVYYGTDGYIILDQHCLYACMITLYAPPNELEAQGNFKIKQKGEEKFTEGTLPEKFNGKKFCVVDTRGKAYNIELYVRQLGKKEQMEKYSNHGENCSCLVVVYDTKTHTRFLKGNTEPVHIDKVKLHCIAVDSIKDGWLTGWNSVAEGDPNEKPVMHLKHKHVTLSEINVVKLLPHKDQSFNLMQPADL